MKKVKNIVVAGVFAVALLVGMSSSVFAYSETPCYDIWRSCMGSTEEERVNNMFGDVGKACDNAFNTCLDVVYGPVS